MTGRRVVTTLLFVATATAVVPPALAGAVHRRRVSRAETDVADIASRIRGAETALQNVGKTVEVLCGSGAMPRALTDAARRWIDAPRGALAAAVGDRESIPIDPWGNCYVVKLATAVAEHRTPGLVLSAGPNGIIETPFSADAPLGNDVARSLLLP